MDQSAPLSERDHASHQDFPIIVANMPTTPQHRRLALGVLVLLLIIAAITVPFAQVQAPRIPAFIPVLQSVMCIADIITATLLFGQYSVEPRRAILALASGYIFGGSFAFLQTLAFSGAYAPHGVFGDGLETPGWLFVLWHSTFSLGVLVYALSKDEAKAAHQPSRSIATTIGITVGCILLAIAGLTWFVTQATLYLPTLATDVLGQTTFARQINAFMWALGATTLVVLFLRRRTILDLWLIVTLIAWMPNFVVAAFIATVRFSVAWYAARGFALVASFTVLSVLLTETTLLYSRLASAIALRRREHAARLMNIEAATGAIAHELKQPLAAIAANQGAALMWLKRDPPDLAQVGECLIEIGEANRRADEVITSIRALFKKMPLRRSLVAPEQVARQALVLVQHDLQMNHVSITTDFEGDLPLIQADPVQLQQVMLNLIRNAVDAMARNDPERRRLRIATCHGGHAEVLLLVEDTGPGLGETDRDRVFDPFFTTKPTGTGLGLAISRTILEDHGGNLRVVKTDAQGTTFEIALPVDEAHDGNGPAKS